MANPLPRSVYSLGGVDDGGNPAVPGIGPCTGRAISIYGAIGCAVMHVVLKRGTSCQVELLGNNGQVDTVGVPPVDEWVSYGRFNLDFSSFDSQFWRPTLNMGVPYWRCDILASPAPVGSILVTACVSSMRTIGQVVSPSYLRYSTGIQMQ